MKKKFICYSADKNSFESYIKNLTLMKKLSILFSLVFFAFVISASAQSSTASTDKEKATSEVKCADGTKAKAGCCSPSAKASCGSKSASAKCCMMGKTEAKKSESSAIKTEAVVTEEKATAVTGTK